MYFPEYRSDALAVNYISVSFFFVFFGGGGGGFIFESGINLNRKMVPITGRASS